MSIEFQAVLEHLENTNEKVYRGSIYERGELQINNTILDVLIAEIGKGNQNSSFEAERAISYHGPEIVLFVGVAGGIKDVELGDVVVVTETYGYEMGKEEPHFLPRPNVHKSSYPLLTRGRAEARKTDWRKRINNSSMNRTPEVYVGPIAAGEKLIASSQSETLKLIKSHYNDALAIEMEGSGFLTALEANPHVEALIIRGISDLIDNKKNSDGKGFQEIASKNASAFAFEVLVKYVLKKSNKDATYVKKAPSSKKSYVFFEITQPSEEIVKKEYIPIQGTGATADQVVLIINELPNKTCWLQQGYAIPNDNGDWKHERCHITQGDIKRFIHAIAVPKEKVDKIFNSFQRTCPGGYHLSFTDFNEVLEKIKSIAGDIRIARRKSIKRV